LPNWRNSRQFSVPHLDSCWLVELESVQF
jgi:hypothetical protein